MRNPAPSARPRAWLPDGAIRALDLDAKLAELTRDWSGKWFARQTVRPLETLAPDAPATGEDAWLALERDLAIGLAAGGRTALFGLMLNVEVPDMPRSAEDERLIAEVTQACLDDLCRRLAEAFRLDGSVRWSRRAVGDRPAIDAPLTCTFGSSPRTPLLRLVVAGDAPVGLAKVGLPPPVRAERLAGVAEGVARQDVALSAHVGRCALSLADVAGLSVGDVLVFERAVDAPLDLVVDGGGTPVARCTVARADDRFDLTLLTAIGG